MDQYAFSSETNDGGILYITNPSGVDVPKKVHVIANLDHLLDVEMILGLSCVFPLLKAMHNVINLVNYGMYVCDFIVVMKIY